MNTYSAPFDENGHTGTHSVDFLGRASAHFERLDIVTARLTRRTPRRVLTLGAYVVDGEVNHAVSQGGHFAGDPRVDLDRGELVLAQVENRPHVVQVDQADDWKS